MRKTSAAAALALLGAVLAGCGGDDAEPRAAARPATPAQLRFVEPSPGQVTGPDVTVKLDLAGARVVQRTRGELVPDEGHIHLSVDGKLVSMSYGSRQDVRDLKPGRHSLRAEFVAVDHAPFRNRVVAAVLFTVR